MDHFWGRVRINGVWFAEPRQVGIIGIHRSGLASAFITAGSASSHKAFKSETGAETPVPI